MRVVRVKHDILQSKCKTISWNMPENCWDIGVQQNWIKICYLKTLTFDLSRWYFFLLDHIWLLYCGINLCLHQSWVIFFRSVADFGTTWKKTSVLQGSLVQTIWCPLGLSSKWHQLDLCMPWAEMCFFFFFTLTFDLATAKLTNKKSGRSDKTWGF